MPSTSLYYGYDVYYGAILSELHKKVDDLARRAADQTVFTPTMRLGVEVSSQRSILTIRHDKELRMSFRRRMRTDFCIDADPLSVTIS